MAGSAASVASVGLSMPPTASETKLMSKRSRAYSAATCARSLAFSSRVLRLWWISHSISSGTVFRPNWRQNDTTLCIPHNSRWAALIEKPAALGNGGAAREHGRGISGCISRSRALLARLALHVRSFVHAK